MTSNHARSVSGICNTKIKYILNVKIKCNILSCFIIMKRIMGLVKVKPAFSRDKVGQSDHILQLKTLALLHMSVVRYKITWKLGGDPDAISKMYSILIKKTRLCEIAIKNWVNKLNYVLIGHRFRVNSSQD